MLVLGLDTCGSESTLALGELEGEALQVLRQRTLAPRTAANTITAAMREILGELAPSALGALVVVRGPGSFTGMRIGLSAAKAVSEALSVPLVGVSRLEVFAREAGAGNVALDAGRGSVYLRSPLLPGEGEQRMDVAQVQALAIPDLAVCEKRVAGYFPFARPVSAPDAGAALRAVREEISGARWSDVATLDALYLWPAEQMLAQAQPSRQPSSDPDQ